MITDRGRDGVEIGLLGRILRRPYYVLWRVIEKCLYEGREYALHVPYGHRILTPWNDRGPENAFGRLYMKALASGPMSVATDRSYMIYEFVRRAVHVPGEMAECGVFTGGTAQVICGAAELERSQHSLPPSRLHLFDTFAGMPDMSVPFRDYHKPGDFAATSVDMVRGRLAEYEDQVAFHVGVMPDTFEEIQADARFSFVHVDVDIYPSVVACCEWFWPRLTSGGVLLFDDYGFYPYRKAARAAVDQFFARHRERPVVLPTGQALVVKL